MSLDISAPHRPDLIYAHLPRVAEALEMVAMGFELTAVGILLLGFLRFAAMFLHAEWRGGLRADGSNGVNSARVLLARYILAALEVFIVADLILTVLSSSWQNLAFLALLVLIRTLISHFLEQEMKALEGQQSK